jgi:CHASE3 domain sensor protein
VDHQPESPFDNVESAHQFVELLCEAIEEAQREVEQEIAQPQSERRAQALQLVSYNLGKLAVHMGTSRRILNDLRTLRRLFFQERTAKDGDEAETAGAAGVSE